jgi:hypothetical protein
MDGGLNYGANARPSLNPACGVNCDVIGIDERAWQLRLEQDLSEWFTLAARYDWYTPNSAQADDGRSTWSFVGVIHFTKGLQLNEEYDHATDNVHTPGKLPPGKHIDMFSSVLQVRF